MPSTRSLAASGSAIAVLAATGVVAAQSAGAGSELDLGVRLAARFVGTFLIQLLIAGLAVVFGPKYVRERVREIRNRPGEAFGWGLLVGIALPVGLALLGITVIGLLVTIPGLILVAVVGIVGNAVAIVWIGSVVTRERENPGGKAALLGALALAVPAAVPVLGNFVTTVVGFFGTGVVGKRLYESWRS